MATALISFKRDSDGRVRVAHIFFASSKSAAEAELAEHATICPKFGPAYRADQTIEFVREIAELPPADGDELEEWLADLLCDEEDDDHHVIDMEPEE
jgi:hypothetical protein